MEVIGSRSLVSCVITNLFRGRNPPTYIGVIGHLVILSTSRTSMVSDSSFTAFFTAPGWKKTISGHLFGASTTAPSWATFRLVQVGSFC